MTSIDVFVVINILSNRSEWTFYFLSSVQFNFTISVFEIEKQIAQKMGAQKMEQLVALNEEWSDTFWELLRKKGE